MWLIWTQVVSEDEVTQQKSGRTTPYSRMTVPSYPHVETETHAGVSCVDDEAETEVIQLQSKDAKERDSHWKLGRRRHGTLILDF